MDFSNQKDEYAKSASYFLAELLRTRKISLKRVAEIGQKVIDHINLIDTEQDFLKLVKELSADFEELNTLGDRVQMSIGISQRKSLEHKVLDFVAFILPQDTTVALAILQEAVKEDVRLEDLCGKFPRFGQFIAIK